MPITWTDGFRFSCGVIRCYASGLVNSQTSRDAIRLITKVGYVSIHLSIFRAKEEKTYVSVRRLLPSVGFLQNHLDIHSQRAVFQTWSNGVKWPANSKCRRGGFSQPLDVTSVDWTKKLTLVVLTSSPRAKHCALCIGSNSWLRFERCRENSCELYTACCDWNLSMSSR